ncbi:hypothetical protein [Amycolatopsis pretoriensis]|uniref:hypothetical protein n=1 Tax=Amycolatopsis pretoriensis TaxID=218821 RepID=UPI00115F940D|nr:hypothetical protein [Amycolatopsis pretoriensis]
MTKPATRASIPVTCTTTHVEHEVPEEAIAVERDDVRLPTLCDDQLIPAPGAVGPSRICRPCKIHKRALAEPPPDDPEEGRQPIDVADLIYREGLADQIPRQRDRAAHRRTLSRRIARLVHRRPAEPDTAA